MTAPLRTLWTLIGWVWLASVVVFSLVPSPPKADVPMWDKLNHLAAYGLLMFWFAQLTPRWLQLAAGLLMLSGLLELAQGLTGYREASLQDMVANALGLALGALLAWRLPSPLAWLEARRT